MEFHVQRLPPVFLSYVGFKHVSFSLKLMFMKISRTVSEFLRRNNWIYMCICKYILFLWNIYRVRCIEFQLLEFWWNMVCKVVKVPRVSEGHSCPITHPSWMPPQPSFSENDAIFCPYFCCLSPCLGPCVHSGCYVMMSAFLVSNPWLIWFFCPLRMVDSAAISLCVEAPCVISIYPLLYCEPSVQYQDFHRTWTLTFMVRVIQWLDSYLTAIYSNAWERWVTECYLC